jgi:hypothetical protein
MSEVELRDEPPFGVDEVHRAEGAEHRCHDAQAERQHHEPDRGLEVQQTLVDVGEQSAQPQNDGKDDEEIHDAYPRELSFLMGNPSNNLCTLCEFRKP